MVKTFTINVACEGVERADALAVILEVVEQHLDGPLAQLNPQAWLDLSAGEGFDKNPVQVRVPKYNPEIVDDESNYRISGQESVDRIVKHRDGNEG